MILVRLPLLWRTTPGITLVVTLCALAVVTLRQASRESFTDLARLVHERDDLVADHGRLLLEESAYAGHRRLEDQGQGRLGLAPPADVRLVMYEGPMGLLP